MIRSNSTQFLRFYRLLIDFNQISIGLRSFHNCPSGVYVYALLKKEPVTSLTYSLIGISLVDSNNQIGWLRHNLTRRSLLTRISFYIFMVNN